MPEEKEMHLLQRRLDNHIERFDEHVEQQNERWERVVRSQEQTTASIDKLVACTTDLHDSTKGVVEAWETGTSVVKFGGMVGRFLKWLAGLAVVGGAINWLIHHLKL